jgi:hypothetical protein
VCFVDRSYATQNDPRNTRRCCIRLLRQSRSLRWSYKTKKLSSPQALFPVLPKGEGNFPSLLGGVRRGFETRLSFLFLVVPSTFASTRIVQTAPVKPASSANPQKINASRSLPELGENSAHILFMHFFALRDKLGRQIRQLPTFNDSLAFSGSESRIRSEQLVYEG